jgi:hypothetical protein
MPRLLVLIASLAMMSVLTACYPRYDWRDYRPDCEKTFCGFVASFPGRVTNATREVPVGAMRLPLALNVVSVGDVTFAIGAFDLPPGSDVVEARATFERKLLGDVGAAAGRRGRVTLHLADRQELEADTFEAEGQSGATRLKASARFVERQGRLIEILVIGPEGELSKNSGKQVIETFFTSVRLD